MTVASAAASSSVRVELGARSYDVSLGVLDGEEVAVRLAAALRGATGVAVLVDAGLAALSPRVAPLLESLQRLLPGVCRLDLAEGEACKTLAQIERTTDWLARSGFDRGAAVVGLGGGATGDHAGFAASMFLRGVRFALCPTTLLAMVDASVGGKTAVDLPAGKNLVGAFHQPAAVVADLGFLETLPRRQLVSGMAEVVKTALIGDGEMLALIEQGAADGFTVPLLQQLVLRSVRVKADVVSEDERESGRRATLNFGHTVGHALEAASSYQLLHGEAVGLGMLAALEWGATLGVNAAALVGRVRGLLERLGLPVDLARRIPGSLEGIAVDKKRHGASLRFIFCAEPGRTIMKDVSAAELGTYLNQLT